MTSTSENVRGEVVGRDVVVSVDIAAEPLTIWNALTRPLDLAAWLGPVVEGRPGPGHSFHLEHTDGVRSRHVVRRWELRSRLGYSWDFPGERATSVCFDIVPLEDRCRVSVRHESLENPVAYAAGWHRHLEYLAAHVAGEAMPIEDFWKGHEDLQAHYTAP